MTLNNEPFRIEDQWCQMIPLLHRAMSDPTLVHEFLIPSMELNSELAHPYWETLHYLLMALLGWQNPGLGLAWWFTQGKPVDDSALLSLVAAIWDRDQALDLYAAWVWQRESEELKTASSTASQLAQFSPYHELNWWREFLNRSQPPWDNPFYGGSNPLHLDHSNSFGFDEVETDESELYYDLSSRKAVLIVNNLGSWRRDLKLVELRLPDLGLRSWYVKVIDKQFGFLGEFRKSRQTGQWFQGKHGIHSQGNKLKTKEW